MVPLRAIPVGHLPIFAWRTGRDAGGVMPPHARASGGAWTVAGCREPPQSGLIWVRSPIHVVAAALLRLHAHPRCC
jgi:hypothetical protein